MRIEIGNAADVIKTLKEGIDLVLTSPPYFRTRKYGKYTEEIGQEKNVYDYIFKLKEVFEGCYRILKPSGVCIVNIADTYAGGELNKIPSIFADTMTIIGFHLINDIIWKKKNGNPSSVKSRLRNEHEHIFVFIKDLNRYYFNPLYEPVSDLQRGLSAIRDYKASDRIGTSSRQRYYEEQRRLLLEGKVPLKVKGDVWEFATSKFKDTKHVAMFPIEIPYYCLKMACPRYICSICDKPYKQIEEFEVVIRDDAKFGGIKHKEGVGGVYSGNSWKQKFFSKLEYKQQDCKCIMNTPPYPGTVLDPFVGSGTTTTVADIMGYNGIGIDLEDMTEDVNYEKIRKKVASLSTITIKITSKNKKVFQY